MTDDNDDIARLLRLAGRRPQPPPAAMERMRSAVHAAWRRRLRERAQRRWFAAAASVLLVVAAGALTWRGTSPSPDTLVARVVASSPSLHIDHAGFDPVRDRDPEVIRIGDHLVTGNDAGATLAQFPGGGTTLRLDRDTEVAWSGAAELRVLRGNVYVDTGSAEGGSVPLTLLAGEVRIAHVGTRFMTRVQSAQIRVAVRDGRVRVQRGADSRLAGRGEEIRAPFGRAGELQIARVATSGEHWRWADALAPATPVEGRRLGQVLEALAWQSGRELQYADEAVAKRAGEVILHGPALTMPPDDAIETVLATTPFRAQDAGNTDSGVLRVELAAAIAGEP